MEEILRSYIHPFGDDWDLHLGDAEFAYNNSEQRSTGQTPFYLLHGSHPRTPLDLYNPTATEENPAARNFVELMLQGHQAAKAAIEQAGRRQKEAYDRKRASVPFKAGDWVYLSSDHCKFQGRTDKLTKRFLGPYKIDSFADNDLAATLRLPAGVRIHPTVHVSRLKKYRGPRHPDGAPVEEATAKDFGVQDDNTEEEDRRGADLEIETVIAWRNVERARPPHQVFRQEFLVKWKGREDSDNTWVSRSALGDHKDQADYLKDAGYLDEEAAARKAR